MKVEVGGMLGSYKWVAELQRETRSLAAGYIGLAFDKVEVRSCAVAETGLQMVDLEEQGIFVAKETADSEVVESMVAAAAAAAVAVQLK